MVPIDLIAAPAALLAVALASLYDLSLHRPRLTDRPDSVGVFTTNDASTHEDSGEAHGKSIPKQEPVLDPEVDGEPIDEDNFWKRMRKRKAVLGLLFLLLMGLRFFALGWDVISRSDEDLARQDLGILEDVMTLVFWAVNLAILLVSWPANTVSRHWRCVVHLSMLTTAFAVATWVRIILPSSSYNQDLPNDRGREAAALVFNTVLVWSEAALGLVVMWIAATTPRGPYLHFRDPYVDVEPHEIPPAAAAAASSDSIKARGNVNLIASCSVVGFLFFNWVGPVVRIGLSKEQLDETDLPHLTAGFRAARLFRKFTGSIKEAARGQTGRFKVVGKAPKAFNPLLWRIIHVNKEAFVVQFLLAILNSFLYYLPAFMLQRIVQFLEQPRQDQDVAIAYGYAYCAGLLGSMILEALVSAQLWYLSNSVLCTGIRVQLNTAIYAKTLRRKDVAGLSASSKAELKATAANQEDAQADQQPISGASRERGPAGGDSEAAPLLLDNNQAATAAPRSTGTGNGNGKADSVKTTKKKGSEKETEEGGFGSKSQVLNLFTIDADRIADFALWSFSLVDAPVEVFIGTVFLYQLLGVASLIGVASSLLFLPLNHYTSKYYANVQDKLMAARDRRVSLMNEVLSSIKMIKYMAWEQPFEEKILRSRDEELKHLRRNFLLEVSFNAIWLASPIVCVLVSFFWYTKVEGNALTPATAFTSLAVFQELKFAINTLPETFVNALQALVSLRRIENYFASAEIGDDDIAKAFAYAQQQGPSSDDNEGEQGRDAAVAMRSATISWPAEQEDEPEAPETRTPLTPSRRRFYLEDVTVNFPVGELSLICGSLGSGKTLMLLALLGEADLLTGQILCPRSPTTAIDFSTHRRRIPPGEWILPDLVAYVPQQAFLQNASIKLNILFGLPLDEERYQATVEACSLTSDLKILEDGDATEIGEKGVVLSGGQKARVSLARAVYSRAQTILLDDVLSAVDAHTARHLVEQCLKGALLSGRTVILVSHHVQLCASQAAYVVCLSNGSVEFEGPGDAFKNAEQYKTLSGGAGDEDEVEEAPRSNLPRKLTNKHFRNVRENKLPQFSSGASSPADSGMSSTEDEESDVEEAPPQPPRKLIGDEARAVGHVSWSIWFAYFKANGAFIFWFIFTLVFLGSKVMDVAENYVLSLWSGSNNGEQRSFKRSTDYYLGLYALVTISNIFVATARWLVLYDGGIRASRTLHKALLHSVLRAPLRWFDKMSLGRLINRFAKDQEGIDSALPDNLGRSLMYGLSCITTIVTIASVTPLFLVAFAFLSIGYLHYARQYSQTARECRRLESVSKSPLYAIYSETISGTALIRAFGASERFMSLALQRIDTNVRFFYMLWSANRWLSIRFSLLSACSVGLTGFFLLQARDRIEASLAGFALTFALSISGDALFLVRRYTALELSLVAVERVKEYSEIELEAAAIVEPRPPANWPHSGEVSVEALTVRYAPELPDVLHYITFHVPAGKKVGIVGSTGCGKSTLAQSFFRFVEAHEGRIRIDGLDISHIGLIDLRSRLTIIPQDPTILSGSLRSTLDVFNEYSDQEIFESLRRVALIPADDVFDDGANEIVFRNLDTEVSESGSNMSQGQRQLLCMARALLKRSKLLLLDEATSSIDYESDALVNKTIRTEFADSTLLVIAHRLRTIIDFDYVLVLDAGRVVEYDAPATLLANAESRFHALCRSTGRAEFRALRRIAEGKPAAKRPKRRKSQSKKPAVPEEEAKTAA